MSDVSPQRIGEILSAPGLNELEDLAVSQSECVVIIIDSRLKERVALRLIVVECKQEVDPRLGETWPIARVTYRSAPTQASTRQLYTGLFAARQVHDWRGAFSSGTMEEF